jgi:dinuclear metal center YbgI/SA1388 family protein
VSAGCITRDELRDYLATVLNTQAFHDYCPNGLQVEGRATIRRICSAVTASKDIILAAIAQQADALLVHHGLFWSGDAAVITGMKRARLQPVLQHDLNLFAYHLPLDCHLEWGNNAGIGRHLLIQSPIQHHAGKTPGLLWSGELPQVMTPEALAVECQRLFKQAPVVVTASPRTIRRIAWCSGAAQDWIEYAAELGADAYLSGEISERTYYQAKELGIHYFACGHHATERFGIQALGEHLGQQFGIEHEFLDSGNPI